MDKVSFGELFREVVYGGRGEIEGLSCVCGCLCVRVCICVCVCVFVCGSDRGRASIWSFLRFFKGPGN